MAADVTFYYDFTSPYAYLASERIEDLIPDAQWRPFAYPIVCQQIGTLDEVLSRDRAAILANVSPRAAERGVPLDPPPEWPFEGWSLMPLRAAVYADEQGRLRDFTHAAFRTVFVKSRPLTELDNIREAAGEAGLDPDATAEAIQDPAIKQRLKDYTEEAHARGVTGIPTVVVGDEVFWGDDHLDEAAAAAR